MFEKTSSSWRQIRYPPTPALSASIRTRCLPPNCHIIEHCLGQIPLHASRLPPILLRQRLVLRQSHGFVLLGEGEHAGASSPYPLLRCGEGGRAQLARLWCTPLRIGEGSRGDSRAGVRPPGEAVRSTRTVAYPPYFFASAWYLARPTISFCSAKVSMRSSCERVVPSARKRARKSCTCLPMKRPRAPG